MNINKYRNKYNWIFVSTHWLGGLMVGGLYQTQWWRGQHQVFSAPSWLKQWLGKRLSTVYQAQSTVINMLLIMNAPKLTISKTCKGGGGWCVDFLAIDSYLSTGKTARGLKERKFLVFMLLGLFVLSPTRLQAPYMSVSFYLNKLAQFTCWVCSHFLTWILQVKFPGAKKKR